MSGYRSGTDSLLCFRQAFGSRCRDPFKSASARVLTQRRRGTGTQDISVRHRLDLMLDTYTMHSVEV